MEQAAYHSCAQVGFTSLPSVTQLCGGRSVLIECKVESFSQSVRGTDEGPSKGLTQGWGEIWRKEKLLPQRLGNYSLGLYYPLQ